VENDDGSLSMYKTSTTPEDPILGVLDALRIAADAKSQSLSALLAKADMFVHGTTHALNAIIESKVAKTAFLTTQGHPDILVLREGGRADPFDHTMAYPDPYIPRALTFEVPGRVNSAGEIVERMDEDAVVEVLQELEMQQVEAIGVCLLWSVSNPEHELRLGELITQYLPNTPFSLSHILNPTIREYRRASATCIDASLKPLMGQYLSSLSGRLQDSGFEGRILIMTSQGGMMDGGELARTPISAINSGPSLAPIAGREIVAREGDARNIIVADTGGTTYDVSLVRENRVPLSQETWLGQPYFGHMTGFPSVDVKSVGAGGGSIARIDNGGVLHVGPQSAGATPGPACYQRGGHQPTVTDACVVLGYIDPDYFLGGTMELDKKSACESITSSLAEPLGMSTESAALAVVELVTENMVQAILDITVNQGIDPKGAVLVGGGGAAGLNSVLIARRLGCKQLIFPELSAALSAAGGLICDLSADFRASLFASTREFDYQNVNEVLRNITAKCDRFIEESGARSVTQSIEYSVDARYENQVWTLEVPLTKGQFDSNHDIEAFVESFHAAHESTFAVRDPRSDVEIVNWMAKASCKLLNNGIGYLAVTEMRQAQSTTSRMAHFAEVGEIDTAIHHFDSLAVGVTMEGPVIIETPFTSIVIDPFATFQRTENRSLIVYP